MLIFCKISKTEFNEKSQGLNILKIKTKKDRETGSLPESLSFYNIGLFYADTKGISAFWASASVFAKDARQTDLRTAMGTFFIYVCFAVFPFVAL